LAAMNKLFCSPLANFGGIVGEKKMTYFEKIVRVLLKPEKKSMCTHKGIDGYLCANK
jgi:hypothetical protein